MKIKITLTAILILVITLAMHRIKSLKEENDRLLSNQEILLSQKETIMAESQTYKVSDSLNAAKVSELQFTIKEYERYRIQNLQLIENLKIKKSNLEKIIDAQTETINNLSFGTKDSIRIDTITNETDTLKCFSYKSKWTDISGCIDTKRDSVDLQIINRESLKIVETATYKRFLGFLWKTTKVKERQIDVVSENPHTVITNLDYVNIRR